VLSMIGVLFTMPQYFQGVLGTDAMGSGLRLLPLIGGLVVGAIPADRVVRRIGAKLTAATGFVLLAVGLSIGATTAVASSTLFVAIWMAVVGVGMGISLSTTTSAALVELSEERSGVGSAVLQAVNKVGGPFGTAILGSVLSSLYLSRLALSGLAAPLAGAVRQSVFGGVAVAQQLGSAALLHSVRAAFVDGMDAALLVSAGIAVVGIVLTLLFLPRSNGLQQTLPVTSVEERELAGVS
jgi:DHA2 family multidrug resistance protein-like MFS transporter